MTIEQVKAYLADCGLAGRVHEFDVSSATVELAAQALGCEPCLIAKTMSFLVDEGVVLIVLAGDARVDNTKFKAAFHQKAKMLSHEQVSLLTGFPVGGVCPFLAPEGVRVYLDESLRRFETVYPAAGSRNSAVRLTLPELERAARPQGWVDVSKLA
ncbi:MAG: YbaK/EbsC family protein [Clostridia bacterium]|nr:YbaK/EbsC family protein [Clostridia bacterium]MDD6040657.1 YbaK/EbsC family protein [Clostridia bacterium]